MQLLIITFILTLIILALGLTGLGLRMLVVKNGEFRGGCATNSPFLKNQVGDCQVCGASPNEQCRNEDESPESGIAFNRID